MDLLTFSLISINFHEISKILEYFRGVPLVCHVFVVDFILVFISLWIFIILHWCVLDLLQLDVIFKASCFCCGLLGSDDARSFFYWAIMLVALLPIPIESPQAHTLQSAPTRSAPMLHGSVQQHVRVLRLCSRVSRRCSPKWGNMELDNKTETKWSQKEGKGNQKDTEGPDQK